MPRYSLAQRLLHWLIAVTVIGLLAVGLLIDSYGFEGLVKTYGEGLTNLIYKYHKTFGVLVLAAMVIRLAVKLSLGKPAYARPLTRFEHVASNAVHGLFYVLLIAMPVLGWAATAAGGFPVEFFAWNLPPLLAKDEALSETFYGLHGLVGRALIALIVVHAGAAVIHHGAIKKDGVLRRML